jgi:YVTN family beta-propeller protein
MSDERGYRVLGAVGATRGGEALPLAGGRQRALLAALLLEYDRIVPADRLVALLWDGEPPAGAHRTLQVLVSRLRRELGPLGTALDTAPPGWRLRVAPGTLDLARFEGALAAARAARRGDRPHEAVAALDAALAEWSGPALADARVSGELERAAERLEDLRLQAAEDRVETRLDLGDDVVGELQQLVAEHPLRERLHGLLMLALYRAGRQADALAAYHAARRVLDERLGIRPGPRLRELEAQILAHDPTLDAPPPAAEPPREDRAAAGPAGRRVWLLAGALAGAVVLAAVVALAATSGSPGAAAPAARPDSVVAIDPGTNRVAATVRVGRGPDQLTASDGALWVVNFRDRTLSRVGLRTRHVDTVGGLPLIDNVVADGRGGIWVSGFEHPLVSRIDARTLALGRRLRVRNGAEGLAAGGGFVWVTNPAPPEKPFADSVTGIDVRTRQVRAVLRTGATPIFATFGYGAVWTSNHDEGTVSVVRPGVARADTVRVGPEPMAIASGEGAIWVVGYGDRTLWRIDPVTRRVTGRVRVGGGPLSVATGLGSVWVTNRDDGTVSRIDPRTDRVRATIHLGAGIAPFGVVVAGGRVWVTTQACAAAPCLGEG